MAAENAVGSTSAAASAFQTGAEFISFTFSPSPPPESEAGPSNLGKRKATAALRASGGTASRAPDGEVKGENGKKRSKQEKKLAKQAKKGRRKERAAAKQMTGERNGSYATANGKGGGQNVQVDEDVQERADQMGCPWMTSVDWDRCRDPAEMLNEEIDAFYRYVSPKQEEFEVRLFLIELISRSVKGIWPEAVVTPFGSWQTQLYLPHGDIDLVVAHPGFSESKKVRLLSELAQAMRNSSITEKVAVIAKARVPIIKFVTTRGGLNVDISLNQTNGVSASKIINQYLDALPGCRQLILVVKAFLSQRSMNEVYTGGIGSYAVICMVINFLQIHPKLRRMEMDPEENLGTLLIEFFELYGRNFNYDEIVISIRRGGRYLAKRSKGWYRAAQPFLLSIEDPQDQDNDISGGSYGIRQVKATLGGAFEMLTGKLFERAAQISSRTSGRTPASFNPEDMSILGAVVTVRKEARKHRSLLAALHADRRLQKRLDMPPDVAAVDFFEGYVAPPLLRPRANGIRPSGNGYRGSPPKVKRGKGAVTHIMVDDDEVDDEDDEEDAMDDTLGLSGSESSLDEHVIATFEREINPTPDLDDEHGLDVPNGASHSKGKDRFASVSEDDFEIIDPPRPELEEGEVEESRYTATPRRIKRSKLNDVAGPPPQRRERRASDSSVDSIEILDTAPSLPNAPRTDRITRGQSRRLSNSQAIPPVVSPKPAVKVGGQAKKDFWAAKGSQSVRHGDVFETDQEYIALD